MQNGDDNFTDIFRSTANHIERLMLWHDSL
jgi:hypothetical protein